MNDESIDPKEKLRNLLEEGEEIGNNIADQGRERTEEGQSLADLARGTRKVLDTMPDGFPFSSFENAIEYWRNSDCRYETQASSSFQTLDNFC